MLRFVHLPLKLDKLVCKAICTLQVARFENAYRNVGVCAPSLKIKQACVLSCLHFGGYKIENITYKECQGLCTHGSNRKKRVVKTYLHFGCLLHVPHAKLTKLPISLLMYFIKTIHGSDFHTQVEAFEIITKFKCQFT